MSDQKREPSCNCITLTDEALAKTNEQLRTIHSLTGGWPERLYVETTPLAKKRGQKDRKILADYCPFCGVRYGWRRTDRVDVMTRGAS